MVVWVVEMVAAAVRSVGAVKAVAAQAQAWVGKRVRVVRVEERAAVARAVARAVEGREAVATAVRVRGAEATAAAVRAQG